MSVILLGDYGAGKSMTLREIYYGFRQAHLRSETVTFPVYLNLRDHWGQTDPAEVIERHARSIGFPEPYHLVRAWRAGYVHLLIDGFDELSATNIHGFWRKLQESRHRAMRVVRSLIDQHPSGTGLLVSGRAYFFDNPAERHKALGLSNPFIELSLNEFTDEQIKTLPSAYWPFHCGPRMASFTAAFLSGTSPLKVYSMVFPMVILPLLAGTCFSTELRIVKLKSK